MSNLLFAARRALVSQPLGMTINILKRKLFKARGAPASNGEATPARLPIDGLYGIDTGGIIHASALRSGSGADIHSFGYGASLPSVIRRAIETCPNLDQASFVDLGCGKGLPLAVATEYPFRRIVGVELSPALCAVARQNAQQVAAAHPERTRIEIVESDMLTADLPDGYLIAYLYNPAYPPLLRRLVRRLAERQAQGAKVMVIYYNPSSAKYFDRNPAFARYYAAHLKFDEEEIAASPLGNDADSIAVWQGVGQPMYPPLPGADSPIDVVAGGSCGHVRQG
jgi:SAM-dependent methyltransferase